MLRTFRKQWQGVEPEKTWSQPDWLVAEVPELLTCDLHISIDVWSRLEHAPKVKCPSQ
jgi:hypothetical protein